MAVALGWCGRGSLTKRRIDARRHGRFSLWMAPPGVVRGAALQPLIAASVNQITRLPRRRKAASSSAQLVPRRLDRG